MRTARPTGWLRRFARARSGVAAVEFALIVPMLLVLYMGASELAIALTLNRKLQGTASTTADLVGQLSTTSSSELVSILNIAKALVEPYDSREMKMVMSSVTIDSGGRATVDWSKAINGATAYAKKSNFALPASFSSQRSRSFVVAEVDFTYKPLGGYGMTKGLAMHETAYLTPRNISTALPCGDC